MFFPAFFPVVPAPVAPGAPLWPSLPASKPAPGVLITSHVIQEHTPALLAYARRLLRRPEDAEDVVQETWISALKSAHSFEGRSSLRTWLTGILRRRVYDRYQGERFMDPLLEEPFEDAPGPEPRDLRDAAEYVNGALSELQELERTAVMLCDIEDWEREEAAEHMHVTRGHLRVLLHRARNKLEQHLHGKGVNKEILS